MSLIIPTSIAPANQGVQIGNANLPQEGPKAVPFVLDFTAQPAYGIDLTYLYSQKLLSMIQTIWIDNSAGDEEVTVVLQGTQQKVICPPGFQGYFPVLSPTFGKVNVYSSGAIVPFFLINVPISSQGGWYPAQTAADFSFNNGGFMQVSDPALEALINTRTVDIPALDVNVVYGGGASGAGVPSSMIGNLAARNGSFNQIVGFASGGNRWYVTAISMILSGDAVGSAAELGVLVQDAHGSQNIAFRNFSVPTAAPAVSLPNQLIMDFTGLIKQDTTNDAFDCALVSGTLTSGFVDVTVWGYQAA